jgi:hypothetical protein
MPCQNEHLLHLNMPYQNAHLLHLNWYLIALTYFIFWILDLVQHFHYPSAAESFQLRCDLKSGDQNTPIRWFKDGEPFQLPTGRPVSLRENNHVIRFSSISPKDDGRYTCVAGDNLASISSEIIVTRPGK